MANTKTLKERQDELIKKITILEKTALTYNHNADEYGKAMDELEQYEFKVMQCKCLNDDEGRFKGFVVSIFTNDDYFIVNTEVNLAFVSNQSILVEQLSKFLNDYIPYHYNEHGDLELPIQLFC